MLGLQSRGMARVKFENPLVLYDRSAVISEPTETRLVVYKKPPTLATLSRRASFDDAKKIKVFDYKDTPVRLSFGAESLTRPAQSVHIEHVREPIFSIAHTVNVGIEPLMHCINDLDHALANLKQAFCDGKKILASSEKDNHDYTEMVLYKFLIDLTHSVTVLATFSKVGVRNEEQRNEFLERVTKTDLPSFIEIIKKKGVILSDENILTIEIETENFFKLMLAIKKDILKLPKDLQRLEIKGRNLLLGLKNGQYNRNLPQFVSIKTEN